MRSFFRLRPDFRRGFTLLEAVVTLAVVAVILIVVLQFANSVALSWKSAGADPFVEAEDALDMMARHLASATLEPYQDYADTTGAFRISAASSFIPDHPARRSDLDFACGPSAGPAGLLTSSGRITTGCSVFFAEPSGYTQTDAGTGLERLVNTAGYFVEFGNDTDAPALILPGEQRWRWRLKQVRQPSESLQIFALASTSAWISQAVSAATPTPIVAENIAALIVLPERAASDAGAALSPAFAYDSRNAANPMTRHQLPPRLRLALVAIDEVSAQVLASQNGTNPPPLVPGTLFQQASQLDTDLASLDHSLTSQKIRHRIFQREILVDSAAWSNTPSQ